MQARTAAAGALPGAADPRARSGHATRQRPRALRHRLGALGIEAHRRRRSVARGGRGADIVVTTTPANAADRAGRWLEPGQHVTAMGSDQPSTRTSSTPRCLHPRRSLRADRLSQTRDAGRAAPRHRRRPDRRRPHVSRARRDHRRHKAHGRGQSRRQITLADLTGTGVQDTAIAALASPRARAAALAHAFDEHRSGTRPREGYSMPRPTCASAATNIAAASGQDPRGDGGERASIC